MDVIPPINLVIADPMNDLWKLPKVERKIEEEKIRHLEKCVKSITIEISLHKNLAKEKEHDLSVYQTLLNQLQKKYNITYENINTKAVL